ncbi:unnamed protein product [Calicophoron daubneyi]|uniref:DnaJ homolog subfamily B member 9 n=1 Tax=Calicophoron daubneyi TaxID=300641 RepID=A0AAV2TZU7_CALDB
MSVLSITKKSFRPLVFVCRLASSRTHYEILGVPRSSSPNEIRSAFIELSKKHHPDKEQGDSELFKEINEAYSILSNKRDRQLYDESLASGAQLPFYSSNSVYSGFWYDDTDGAHNYPFNPHVQETSSHGRSARMFVSILILFAVSCYVASLYTFIRISHKKGTVDPPPLRHGLLNLPTQLISPPEKKQRIEKNARS